MFSRLQRYIGVSVFWAILLVLVVITTLDMVFSIVHELSQMQGGYGLPQVIWYVLLGVPQDLCDMLPMAAMIGSLIGLGTLASNSEITVMRASGVSIAGIVWAVMKPMLVLLLVGILIGEYIAPWSQNKAQGDRALALGSGEAQASRHGYWHRQGDEFVHINSVQPDGRLLGVTRYLFDSERRLERSSFAKEAVYQEGRWQLREVTSTYFHEQRTEVLNRPTEDWDLLLNAKLLGSAMRDPDSLDMGDLWGYSQYLTDQGLSNNRYMLAFWSKLLQPLVTAALVLMAISFVFGPLRSVTLGQRIFTGVLVGFVFRITQQLLGPSSLVFGFPPLFAVLVPILVCSLLGFWLLRRAA